MKGLHHMKEIAIECKKISKTISKRRILKDVDLTVNAGDIVGIIGRNGSGKSMLFKTICGLVIPTGGKVTVFGKDVFKNGDFPQCIGALIEYPGFLAQYSGYKNLKLLADIQGKIGKQEIIKAIETVGLDPNDKRHYRKYSLGMRQKLGIAAAIMENPKILVLDEPTNNLDEESVKEFRQLLIDIRARNNTTILLASHNKSDIESCCDVVYEIKDGVLTPEEVA